MNLINARAVLSALYRVESAMGSPEWLEKGNSFDLNSWSCGTSACAIGWAAQDPEVNKLGLVLRDGLPYLSDGFSPFSWGCVKRFLDIDIHVAELLFQASKYPEIYKHNKCSILLLRDDRTEHDALLAVIGRLETAISLAAYQAKEDNEE